jgi:para-nitrobenzyl esterase
MSINRRSLLTSLASAGAIHTLGGLPLARATSVAKGDPIASTIYGKVRGLATGQVLSFRGMPYAGPAGGANRFMPPVAPTPWTKVRDAIKAGPRSIQQSTGTIFSSALLGDYFSGGRKDAAQITLEPDSEDCLVLNVLTPALRGKRPVMVYIHGGGYTDESGALTLISDRFVAEQNVVLVGINHRLNVFGYTYLGGIDPAYADSGNVGQLDLIAALKWVRDNIASFGGDPSNVTVFGESGGGAKISALLAMPGAKGLFHRAIIESGSFRKIRARDAAIEDTGRFLSKLGLAASQIGELRAMPAAKLLAAYTASSKGLGGPVIDGRSIPHSTWEQGAPPEASGVSLIIGICKDEATVFDMEDTALHSLDWPGLKERQIKSGIPADKADVILDKYRASYPNDSPSDLYFRIATDKGFRANAVAQADAKWSQRSGDVYMYYFAWNTGVGEGRLRAFHTAELPLAMRLVANPAAEELSRQIAGAWAGFARTGNPNHAGLPQWQKYSVEQRATMVFDAGKSAVVHNPAMDELALLAPFPKGYPYQD